MPSDRFGVIAPHPPIIVPEVGGSRSSVTGASLESLASARQRLERFAPDTVVVMSPHAPALADAFVVETAPQVSGSLAQFGAPQVSVSHLLDTELADRILDSLDRAGIPVLDRASAPHLSTGELDHGVVVPMRFLDPDGRWPVVVLSLADLDYETHRQLGRVVAECADALGRRVAFVASGDCSHRLTHDGPYPYSPHAKKLDDAIVALVGAADFQGLADIDPVTIDEAGECGLRSFITLGGFLGDGAEARVLAYEGPWGVGYLTAVAGTQGVLGSLSDTPATGSKGGVPGAPEDELPALARAAIEAYLREGRTLAAPRLADPALPERAGAFVSLHRERDLRGCIGTIEPTQPTLAAEVVHNAIDAATRDPRFPTLTEIELDDLDISVDVLHPAEPCAFEDLDPKRYGVIVSNGYRRGLLLPDLEGVDTAEQQVAIALRKAGIMPGERYELRRFKVDRYA